MAILFLRTDETVRLMEHECDRLHGFALQDVAVNSNHILVELDVVIRLQHQFVIYSYALRVNSMKRNPP